MLPISTSGEAYVDGVSILKSPIVLYDGQLWNAAFAVADGAGSAAKAIVAIAITGDMHLLLLDKIQMSSSISYYISGTVYPVGADVYLSYVDSNSKISDAFNNIFATTTSDMYGKFSFDMVTGIDGDVICWIKVDIDNLATVALDCNVTTKYDPNSTPSDPSTPIDYFIYRLMRTVNSDIVCPSCNGIGCSFCSSGSILEPVYDISGTCPEDCDMVMISLVPNDLYCDVCNGEGHVGQQICPECLGESQSLETCSTCNGLGEITTPCSNCDGSGVIFTDLETVQNKLSSSILASTTTQVGAYNISANSYGQAGLWAIWGTTKSGGELTIDSIEVSEGFVECLAGDTLITLSDGSLKQLDALNKGEFVMSKDGNPTAVISVCHNHYNPYHKLYYFEDGTVIDEVSTHRFFNIEQGFFQHLRNWKLGEHALNQNGEHIALVNVKTINEEKERFGLLTGDGTYFANGLLSGPALCNQPLLATATTEQIVDMMLSVDESYIISMMGLEGVLP